VRSRPPIIWVRSAVCIPGLLSVCCEAAWAADATTPVDYTQRNEAFAPAASVPVQKKEMPTADGIQGRKVEKPVNDRKMLPAPGDGRAAIEVGETRDKTVVDKNVRQPEKIERQISGFNQKPAAITTAGDTTKPPMVAKFQDRLTAASATNMARFPALDGATGAKINRFVFRKNGEDSTALTNGAPVTPAGGTATIGR